MNNPIGDSYPLEFYTSSANRPTTSDQPISATVKEQDINVTTLRTWIEKSPPNEPSALQLIANSMAEDLKRLRKESRRLKQEIDILKKAAADFRAKHSKVRLDENT